MKTIIYVLGTAGLAGLIYYLYKNKKAPAIVTTNAIAAPKSDGDIIYDQAISSAKAKVFASDAYKQLQPLAQNYVNTLFNQLDKNALIASSTQSNQPLDRLIMNKISSLYDSYKNAATAGRGIGYVPRQDFFGINGFNMI